MPDKIQDRLDTKANWASVNPTLAQGERGFESDTGRFKYGDGSTAWSSLDYVYHDTRVNSQTSTATLTPDVDAYDMDQITAQAEALAIANPTGTPSNGNGYVIKVTDNGTSRAISFDTKYRAVGGALPTATTIGKTMYIAFVYDSVDDKYDVLPYQEEQ